MQANEGPQLSPPLIAIIAKDAKIPPELDAFLQTVRSLSHPKGRHAQAVSEITASQAKTDGTQAVIGTEPERVVFANFEGFSNYLLKGHIPHLLLIDHPDWAPPRKDAAQLRGVFAELRGQDPNIGIFVFCPELPEGYTLMSWLDAGATALVHRGESGADLGEALEEILLRRLRNQSRRKVRLTHHERLEIHVPNLQQAIVAETLNIGTGGLFLQTQARGIKVGDTLEFSLKLNSAQTSSGTRSVNRPQALDLLDAPPAVASAAVQDHISGSGKVVWVRSTSEVGLPEGIGLQFIDLEAGGQKIIDDFVKKQGTRAFIPIA